MAEKAKRLQEQVENAKPAEIPDQKVIVKTLEVEGPRDKSECKDCGSETDKELLAALKGAEDEDEYDVDDDRLQVTASLHHKVWNKKDAKEEEPDGKEKQILSICGSSHSHVDVSPYDIGKDISLDDLDGEEIALLEKT
eukprot:TRINITY_DN1891_c0_g1_i1.p1 TRINITY_DN1891_c0_g1~~TRINITY_DN1891_c0_g1_i1.p1  ORF type:complete len:139 (-),score=34.92 TRINITY_DN1891_c0_g1_i1:19-435(-)